MSTTNLAKACLAAAEALQQLAAALEAEPAELGTPARPASMMTTEERMARHGLYLDGEPPASVAEPECDCSLYARCDHHEANRPKVCRCNGPRFASSACPMGHHQEQALRRPHHDPALLE